VVGAPQAPFSIHAFSLIMARKSVAGSLIGGIPETQEMLDYCAAKGIVPDVQLISPKDANHAMVSLSKSDPAVRRFVIDMSQLTPDLVVEPDAAIDPTAWKMLGTPVPASARHPAHAAK